MQFIKSLIFNFFFTLTNFNFFISYTYVNLPDKFTIFSEVVSKIYGFHIEACNEY